MIETFAVSLEGLPWKWVKAARIFSSERELALFAGVLSKDAPDFLAIATIEEGHYQFKSAELGQGMLQLSDSWVPLGFALDVKEWRQEYGERIPMGEWISYADLTRPMSEDGDQDRWFAAHFVGPSWWVVPYPPGESESNMGIQRVCVYVGEMVEASGGLIRDDTQPVSFEAELLATSEVAGEDKGEVTDMRGTKEMLYRTEDGRLIVHVEDWSIWQGEPTTYTLEEVTEEDLSVDGRFEALGTEAGMGRPLMPREDV